MCTDSLFIRCVSYDLLSFAFMDTISYFNIYMTLVLHELLAIFRLKDQDSTKETLNEIFYDLFPFGILYIFKYQFDNNSCSILRQTFFL